MKKSIVMMLMLPVSIMAMAKDVKTAVFTTTPQMSCASCENKIKGNLRFEKGVKKITTNIEKQTVTVVYDADKTTPEKLQKRFEKFGYKARQLKDGETVKADTPEACPKM